MPTGSQAARQESAPSIPQNNPNKMRQMALNYAKAKFAVLPIHHIRKSGRCSCGKPHAPKDKADRQPNVRYCHTPGKHPVEEYVPNGVSDATKDLATIRRWFADDQPHNIAIACQPSGIVAVDIDPRNGGNATIAAFDELDVLTSDAVQVSGSGGQHRLFKAPATPVQYKPGPGIEIISNGYFLVAPSNHISGRKYRWQTEGPLQEFLPNLDPAFVTSYGYSPSARKERTPLDPEKLPRELKRVRDALAFLDQEEIELTDAPFDYDQWMRIGFAIHEAFDGSDDAFQIFDDWSATSGKYDAETTEKLWRATRNRNDNPVTLGTLFEIAKGYGWTAHKQPDGSAFGDVSHLVDDAENDKAPSEKEDKPVFGRIVRGNFASNVERRPQLVQGRILERSLGNLWGPSNIGKSKLLAYLASVVSKGEAYHPDNGLSTTKTGVLYVASEDYEGVIAQFAHEEKHFSGLEDVTVADGTGLRLLDPHPRHPRKYVASKMVDAFSALIQAEQARRPCKLVILDMFGPVIGSTSNDEEAIRAAFVILRKLIAETGVTILLCSHTGKDIERGERGSYELRGGVDFSLRFGCWDRDRARQSKEPGGGFVEHRTGQVAVEVVKVRGLPIPAQPDVFNVISEDITERAVAEGYHLLHDGERVTAIRLEPAKAATFDAVTDEEDEAVSPPRRKAGLKRPSKSMAALIVEAIRDVIEPDKPTIGKDTLRNIVRTQMGLQFSSNAFRVCVHRLKEDGRITIDAAENVGFADEST